MIENVIQSLKNSILPDFAYFYGEPDWNNILADFSNFPAVVFHQNARRNIEPLATGAIGITYDIVLLFVDQSELSSTPTQRAVILADMEAALLKFVAALRFSEFIDQTQGDGVSLIVADTMFNNYNRCVDGLFCQMRIRLMPNINYCDLFPETTPPPTTIPSTTAPPGIGFITIGNNFIIQ